MSKCDFNKVAKQLYWNRTSTWLFCCKFAAYFQNTFSKEHLLTAAFVIWSKIISTSMLLCIFYQWKFLKFTKNCMKFLASEAAVQWWYLEKVFWKYAANLQENSHAKVLRTPLDGCFCNLKWIVSELFYFSNHSKLIAFHILILRGRRWFRWSESLFIIFSSSFLHGRWGLRSEDQPTKIRFSYCCIIYFLSSSRSYVFYKRVILQNVAIFTEKHLW